MGFSPLHVAILGSPAALLRQTERQIDHLCISITDTRRPTWVTPSSVAGAPCMPADPATQIDDRLGNLSERRMTRSFLSSQSCPEKLSLVLPLLSTFCCRTPRGGRSPKKGQHVHSRPSHQHSRGLGNKGAGDSGLLVGVISGLHVNSSKSWADVNSGLNLEGSSVSCGIHAVLSCPRPPTTLGRSVS